MASFRARLARSPAVLLPALTAVALAAVALTAVHGGLTRPVRWAPDGLFYQARLLQIRGESHDVAYARVFDGPISERLRRVDPSRIGDPAWVAYNERFFERRVALPLAGAAIEPVAGERALSILSIAGYVAAVLAVFLALLLRFRLAVAAAVALATAALPALSDNAPLPLTDTWGVALVAAALGAAILVLDRGPRWLPLWIAVIAVLSFTRDSTLIPVLAAGWLALTLRTRLAVRLALAGVLAAAPAYVVFGAPMRELLAFVLADFHPRPDASWMWIAGRYPEAIVDLVRSDLGFLRRGQWLTGLYLLGGTALLLVPIGRAGDPARTLVRAAAAFAVLYVLAVPVFSAFRLELMLVPAAAFGLASGGERLAAAVTARRATRLAERAVVGTPASGHAARST